MAALSGSGQGDPRAVAQWDLVRGVLDWRLWAFLALQDIRQRYRRSAFGPLWLTMGLGITVLGIGLLYSQILKQPSGTFIPFIAISLLIWNLVSGVLIESTGVFQGNGHVITSVQVPYTSFILRNITRNLIVAAHSIIVVVIVFAWFRFPVTPVSLAAIPGLVLLCANLYWMSLAVGLLCARYRDAAQIINYIVALMVFITPIIWQPSSIRPGNPLLRYNPFAQMVEVIRGPLFSHVLPLYSFGYLSLMLVIALPISLFLFMRTRRYLVYWI